MNITHTVDDQYNENQLEIEETKARINSLELRLERLQLRDRILVRYIADQRRNEATAEEQEQYQAEQKAQATLINTGVKDSSQKRFIFVGDRVKLSTGSKNNPVFAAGTTTNIVTGTTNDKPEKFVKIQSLRDRKQTTKRKGKYVTICNSDDESTSS